MTNKIEGRIITHRHVVYGDDPTPRDRKKLDKPQIFIWGEGNDYFRFPTDEEQKGLDDGTLKLVEPTKK